MKKIFYITLSYLVFSSCSTKKNLLYLQDLEPSKTYSNQFNDYKISTDDILKIDVFSNEIQTSLVFNPRSSNPNFGNSKESLLLNGYLVDSDGFINFPVLGRILVKGKSTNSIRDHIHQNIIDKGYIINPIVDVKLINAHFTILGEVSLPGRYDFLKNDLNILEAIGMAGDLTINGLRNNIKVIRNVNHTKSNYNIDLTSSNFMESNKFQVLPGDVIIINPNSTRVKNAGIIGSSGTLLSLLSFILSSIIVINN